MRKVLLILSLFIYNYCSTKTEILICNNNILEYENLSYSDSILIKYLITHNKLVSYSILDTSLTSINSKEKVTDSIYSIFTEFGVVNGSTQTQKDIIKEESVFFIKESYDLFYIGEWYSKFKFNSFLFMLKEKEGSIDLNRDVYMLNLYNDTITSILKIQSYFLFNDGVSCFSYLEKNDKFFIYKSVDLSTDAINPFSMENYVFYTKFLFDQYGHVKTNESGE